MAFEPDTTYNGVITQARFIESSNGSDGLELKISVPTHGSIYHTIWLTAKALERGKKTLIEIGVDPDALKLRNFWTAPEDFLVDKPVQIVTELHEYNGKTSVRSKFLNGPNGPTGGGKAAAPSAVDRMLSLFGGMDEQPTLPWADDDNDNEEGARG